MNVSEKNSGPANEILRANVNALMTITYLVESASWIRVGDVASTRDAEG